MGRLLEALKRLESEMPAGRPVDPIVKAGSPSDVAPSMSIIAVLEPPVGRCEESPAEIDSRDDIIQPGKSDRQSVEEMREVENLSYMEVSAKIDSLGWLLDEKLPLRDEVAMNATLDRAESAIAAADANSGVFVEKSLIPHSPAPLQEGQVEEAESRDNFLPPDALPKGEGMGIGSKPETHANPGVFGAMARNILAQLPAEGSAALYFTSPTDGEGKTETILPLAEALIEASGRRTILMDANLHRPDLTREWRFSSRRGIFDVLIGEADWWEAVQKTGLAKLSILVNNGLPQRHAILSQPLAFSELLENLKKEYRLVLIDSASLVHAESVSMARYCQGVYLVVRLGHSSRRAVREARQVIAQAGGKLLGCIAVGDVLAPA